MVVTLVECRTKLEWSVEEGGKGVSEGGRGKLRLYGGIGGAE